MSLDTQPIVVLGSPRSGTSAISEALAHLGVFLGSDKAFFPADVNNERGYFEIDDLMRFNQRCLASFQMSMNSITPLPEDWRDYPLTKGFLQELKELLKANFNGKGRWGFKQPLVTIMIPIYEAVFGSLGLTPHYVLCVRNPLEISASEAKWNFVGGTRVLAPLGTQVAGIWLRYTLGTLVETDVSKLTVMPYEDFLGDPRRLLEQMIRKIGGWEPDEAQWGKALSGVVGGLRHNKSSSEDLQSLPPIVRYSYDLCREIAACEKQSGQFRAQAASLWTEYQQWVNMMREQGLVAGTLGLAWYHDGTYDVFEQPYMPTGHWQTIRLKVNAPPRTVLMGSMHNNPCEIWIRRAVWHRDGSESPAPLSTGPCCELTNSAGTYRLLAASEPSQLIVTTPGGDGPYELDLEFLWQSGYQIALESTLRLSKRLSNAHLKIQALERQPSGSGQRR